MKEIKTSKGNYKVTKDGDISDGYHSFEELYRMLYNAAFFKELSSKFRVERYKRHSDGELCFGEGWFIVVTELPQGQISNHYENKYWDLFDFCETVDKPTIAFDGHETNDALERMLRVHYQFKKNNLTNNDMEYFKKRLIEEEKELAIKVDKLTKFIGSERFNILSETEGTLLKIQFVYMNGYLDTLRFRMKSLDIKYENVDL